MKEAFDTVMDSKPAQEMSLARAEPAPIEVLQNRPPDYVTRDAVSIQHFVNRYLRTRQLPVNRGNRVVVQEAMARYRGSLPARCIDMEAFLDATLGVTAQR